MRTVLSLSPTLFEHICTVNPVGTERSVIATIAAVAGLLMPTSLPDHTVVSGVSDGIRARNFLSHIQGLYLLSYAHSASCWDRTSDFLHVEEMLYR